MNARERLEAMLASGELARVAATIRVRRDLAAALGMTDASYDHAVRDIRKSGKPFPTVRELQDMGLGRAPAQPAEPPLPALPDGHRVRGVSTYVGPDGEIRGQWIKTGAEQEDKHSALIEAMTKVADAWRGKAEPVPSPVVSNEDLLCVVPMGDPHLGLYAWSEETGQDFDLDIAERNLVAAADHLIALAPPAKEALIISLGDFFHTDTSANQTMRSHHALDVDTRWSKVLAVGIRTMRRIIDRALEKHETVNVICEIGNHDDHSAIMLGLCLAQFYEREPRVRVDTSPAKFHWFRFGDNLIGVTHGDTVKPDKLPGVMAHDRARDWGETVHRYWYTGHVHHKSQMEYPGVIVETFGTLAPRDAYAAGAGYRSGQDLCLDVIHRKWGRINRHTVGIRQLTWEAA